MTPADPNYPVDPDAKEEIYYEGSPRGRSQLGAIFLWFLAGVAVFASPFLYKLASPQKELPPSYIAALLFIVGLVLPFVPILLARTTRYCITNYRIDFERGVLGKDIDTLELWHVADIRFHQSLFDRILNVGTITIFSPDSSTPVLPLRGIPNPRPIYECLKQRIIAVKRQRGVLKLDAG